MIQSIFHIVIFLTILSQLATSDWASPFFISERDDVKIDLIDIDYVSISMNEEITAPFTLCYLNEYSGSESPRVTQFSQGDAVNLGLKLEQKDSRWHMIVSKRQDYENILNRRYIFDMQIGLTTITVDIIVLNIFDNTPTVSYENPCVIPELTDPDYESSCSYIVTDDDGMIDNDIKFSIEGNFGEDEIFTFILDKSSMEDYSQTYQLGLKKTLYYDQRIFYSFRVRVSDAGDNTFVFNLIVEVKDMPNKPPMWTRAFVSAQFPELENQTFHVEAIDGDTGINAPVCYMVEFEDDKDFSELISINKTSGVLEIEPIDRDTLKIDVYPFFIRAFECEDEESWIKNSSVLLVQDINNNIPLVYFSDTKDVIEMDEETLFTLFSLSELSIEDRDLGPNAMYKVELKPEKFAIALSIIPGNGYQLQNFTISVINPKMLDFEVPEFQKFNISIVATEEYKEEHWSEKTFEVHLLNWNDELPIFAQDTYVFELKETVGANYQIGTVLAKDRDVDDKIEYYLTDKTGEKFFVDIETGQLATVLDRTFDFERQEEVTFQVFARDTLQTKNEPTHVTSTQVQINVIDVNDTPPTIYLPKKFLTVTENELLAVITEDIRVFDPDTTADLRLFIDWNTTIATGLNVQREDYEECVDLYIESPSNKELLATLKSSPSKIIDYEKFQVLFLTITAIDLNTEVNEASATAVLTVFVLDVNDNAPEFVGNTLEVNRTVIERADSEIFIGFIHAIDIDGPGNNDITFTLIPHDSETDEWIKIHPKTGELSVGRSNTIDCDIPKRFSVKYEVNISDGELSSAGMISISITDINNKIPQINPFENVIEIYEDVSDYFLANIEGYDLDRDDPHNVVQYSINYQSNQELQRYFTIDMKTGELRVKELDDFNRLDRDHEPSEYFIPIYIEDNLGIGARNGIYTTVHIILLDVNDNAPEMPENLEFTIIPLVETEERGSTIVEQFYAPDIDEGLNGEVLYEIISIEPVELDREEVKGYENLFELQNYENKYTRIRTGIDLKGFSGTWRIEIKAVDRGNETEGGFSQYSKASYEIKIHPFNYNRPVIAFPSKENSVIRLDHGAAGTGRSLTLLNGTKLSPFLAIDDDAGIFGDVIFSIESDSSGFFDFFKIDKKSSELQLKSPVEEKVYQMSILAIDGGNFRSDKLDISLAFIEKTSQPYFELNSWTTIFTENQTGLEETRLVPEAIDPKNFGIQSNDLEFEIFYYLDESYRPEDAQFFTLDPSTRILRLKQMLDRESIDHHSIRIFASNEDSIPPIRFVSDKAMLYIDIAVDDVNDNPPNFVYKSYAVGISERDNLGKILMTLEATDPDLDDVVTYFILKDSMEVSNPELNYLKESAFILNQFSGALTLNFEVQSSMSGYFEFLVEARDLVLHTDTATVKIFIISDGNRVKFTFLNTVQEVRAADQETLVKIFSEAYNAECVIDDILPHQTSSGIADENETDLRAHFIRNNEAIEAEEISQRSSEIVFITDLSSRLSMILSLKLKGLPSYNTGDEKNLPNNKILDITLFSITAVLFIALVVVTIIYTIQRRSYKRQLKAFSTEKKSDVDAEKFNNMKALPNTNIYSGQNNHFNPVMAPTFNNEINDIDNKSLASIDSDDFADLSKSQIFNIRVKNQDNNSTFA